MPLAGSTRCQPGLVTVREICKMGFLCTGPGPSPVEGMAEAEQAGETPIIGLRRATGKPCAKAGLAELPQMVCMGLTY